MDYLYTALKNLLPLLFHPRCPWQTEKQLADALQDGERQGLSQEQAKEDEGRALLFLCSLTDSCKS